MNVVKLMYHKSLRLRCHFYTPQNWVSMQAFQVMLGVLLFFYTRVDNSIIKIARRGIPKTVHPHTFAIVTTEASSIKYS